MTRTSGWVTSASPTSTPPGSTCSTPGGQPGLLEDPGHRHAAGDGGARVGLEDHGVAQRQRRSDRADAQDDRHVERRDDADHAGRARAGPSTAGAPRSASARRRGGWAAPRPRSTPARRRAPRSRPCGGMAPTSRTFHHEISSACSAHSWPALRRTAAALRVRQRRPFPLRLGGDLGAPVATSSGVGQADLGRGSCRWPARRHRRRRPEPGDPLPPRRCCPDQVDCSRNTGRPFVGGRGRLTVERTTTPRAQSP